MPPTTLLDLADRVLYRAGQDWGAVLRHLALVVAAAAAVYVVTSRWTATIGTGITAGVVTVSRYALQRLRRPAR